MEDIIEKHMNKEQLGGLKLVACVPGSVSAEAGCRAGDHVVAVNDRPVKSFKEYVEALSINKTHTKLSVIRNKIEFLEFSWRRKNIYER